MSSNISDVVATTTSSTTINYPYQPITGLDPTVGPTNEPYELSLRLLGITFENIERNIASYPYREVSTDAESYTRTYYMGNSKTIVLTSKYVDEHTIIKTLTGDTGYDGTMQKTIKTAGTLATKLVKDVVYSYL